MADGPERVVRMDRLLTRADVAERLACSLHKAGELMLQMDYVTLGSANGHKRVTETALAAWVDRNTTRQMTRVSNRKATGKIPRWEEVFGSVGHG